MQTVNVAIVLAGLALLGALPATGQPAQPAAPATAAGTTASPANETYLEKARENLQTWRRELDAFDAKAAAEGRTDSRAAADRLHAAWAKTQVEAAKLQGAGAVGWERTKAAFEDASRDFTESFDKVRPQHAAPATP